jgi:hypothetical protein
VRGCRNMDLDFGAGPQHWSLRAPSTSPKTVRVAAFRPPPSTMLNPRQRAAVPST